MNFHARCLCGPPRVRVRDAITSTRVVVDARRADPTGTLKLQGEFRRAMDARWRSLKTITSSAITKQFVGAEMVAHAVATGNDPLRAFQSWFDEALRQTVLGTLPTSWTASFVARAAAMGAQRAAQLVPTRDAGPDDEARDDHGRWTTTTQSNGRVDVHLNGEPVGSVAQSGASYVASLRGKGFIQRRSNKTTGSHAALIGIEPKTTTKRYSSLKSGIEAVKKQHIAGTPILDAEMGNVASRTPLLQTMCVAELQGICEAVSQQCVRAVAEAQLTRQPPPVTASRIADVIDRVGKARSNQLVSFIVVRAFGAATLDGFRASGVTHVGTVAERTRRRQQPLSQRDRLVRDAKKKKKKWAEPDDLVNVLTAGDDLVCPECEAISEEGPYTLDEAEGLIPAHPNCRCAFIPADDARFASVHDNFNPDEPRDANGMWSGLGGAEMKSYRPPAHWASVEGQDHTIHEPPLPKLRPGYSFIDKITGRQVNVAGQRLSSGVIMREPDGRVWLVKPTNGYGGYNYTFPKGGVEDGLHPQANAIKETFEETGLKARITGYAGDYHGDTSITRMYHAVREGGHPKDKGWETEQVALAHPDDLDSMLNRSRDRKIAKHHILGDAMVLDAGSDDEPRDDRGRWTTGTSVLSGNFPHHADYVYHGTSSKNVAKIGKSGISAGSYLTTHPETARQEAMNAVEGDQFSGKAGVGGEPVVFAVKKSLLKGNKFKIDQEYEDGASDFGRAVIIKNRVSPTALTKLSDTQVDKHVSQLRSIVHDDFNPDEPRDDHGMWTSGGGNGTTIAEKFKAKLKREGIPIDKHNDYPDKDVVLVSSEHEMNAGHVASNLSSDIKVTKIPGATMYEMPKYESMGFDNPPAQSAEAPIDMQDLTKVSGKKGSNEGGVYKGIMGDQYYIKQPATKDHVTNELLTAKLYQLAGANTLNYVPVKGGEHVATEMEDLAKNNVSQLTANERTVAQQDFAIHAWLANWDAAGTGGDNVGVRKNGEVVTLDTGGGLKYRAQGEPKGAAFGNEVTEINSLRDPNVNHDAAKLFGDMTNEQMIASMKRVTSIDNDAIAGVVAQHPGMSKEDKLDMTNKLIARKNDLAAQMQKMTGAAWAQHQQTVQTIVSAPKTILGPNTTVGAQPAPPEHPSKKFLSQVKGTSAERVAWRKELTATPLAMTPGSKLVKSDLQHKIIASFWKQHGKLSGAKQQDIAGKLAQYADKYKIANPLDWSAPVAPPTTFAPKTTFGKKGVEPLSPDPMHPDQLKKKLGENIFSAPPTDAELAKAKKNVALQMQYVPGAQGLDNHPEAQKLLAAFNAKYEGKTLAEHELPGKVADFKKLQADMVPLMSAQQQAEVAKAAEVQAAYAAKAKADKAAAEAAEAAKMADPEYKKQVEKAKADMEALKNIGADHYELKSAESTIKKHNLSITPTEGAAIRAYVGNKYDSLNETLRKGQKMSVAQIKYAQLLDSALSKMPIHEGYAQRGIKYDPGFKIFQHYADNVGSVVTEQQFNSAGFTHKLWGPTTLHIQSKTARDIRAFNPGEGGGEMVFRKGVHWHVTKADPKTHEVWIEEV